MVCLHTTIGPLSAVTGFRRLSSNLLTFSWTPPPTLDLTGIDPDIAYSIEIYNITCGSRDLVSSNYNLTTSFYGAASIDPGHVYEVEVVPRSNVPGAKNGTAFVKYGKVLHVCVNQRRYEMITCSDKSAVSSFLSP